MTLKTKLIFSIICFEIIPMLFMPFIVSGRYEKILEDNINKSSQQILYQISNNVEKIIDNMVSASNMLCLDEELITYLKNDKYENFYDWYMQKEKKINGKLYNVQSAALYPYATEIVIAGFDDNIYSSFSYSSPRDYDGIEKQKWFQDVIDLNGYILWMAPSEQFAGQNNISLARLIKDSNGTKSFGVLLIGLFPGNNLFSNLENKSNDAQLYIVNENDMVIAANDPSKVGENIGYYRVSGKAAKESMTVNIGDEKTVVNYRSIPKTKWGVLQMIPYKALTKEINNLSQYMIFINSVFFILLIVITIFISWGVTRPIHKLSRLMSEVPKGNFHIRAAVKGKGETAQLGKCFNIMVQEIEALIVKLNKEYGLKEKARLEALRAQINPHFLLNTLNGIKWMATLDRCEEVSKMIVTLGKLLEKTFKNDNELIPLFDEISSIKDYIQLQKMRYDDKFNIEYDIPNEFLNYRVLCLMVQPIVENSIIHGFSEIQTGGFIKIQATSERDDLYIRVIDNGTGIDDHEIEFLLTDSNNNKKSHSSIGLRNVHNRIQLFFGEKYGLEVKSKIGTGTEINIKLPIIKENIEYVKSIDC